MGHREGNRPRLIIGKGKYLYPRYHDTNSFVVVNLHLGLSFLGRGRNRAADSYCGPSGLEGPGLRLPANHTTVPALPDGDPAGRVETLLGFI